MQTTVMIDWAFARLEVGLRTLALGESRAWWMWSDSLEAFYSPIPFSTLMNLRSASLIEKGRSFRLGAPIWKRTCFLIERSASLIEERTVLSVLSPHRTWKRTWFLQEVPLVWLKVDVFFSASGAKMEKTWLFKQDILFSLGHQTRKERGFW